MLAGKLTPLMASLMKTIPTITRITFDIKSNGPWAFLELKRGKNLTVPSSAPQG